MNTSNLGNMDKKPSFSERKNTEELTFAESERSKYCISRLDSGKIALLKYDAELSKQVRPNETWLCEIVVEDQSKVIVVPLKMTSTPIENAEQLKQKIKELILKYENNG